MTFVTAGPEKGPLFYAPTIPPPAHHKRPSAGYNEREKKMGGV